MAITVACAGAAPEGADRGPVDPQLTEVPAAAREDTASVQVLPPIIDPAPITLEVWQLPDVEQRVPRFPYLPGERRDVSRSIGDVISGHLVQGATLPMPHPHLAPLPIHAQRGLLYATDQMMEVVESAAGHVAAAYPGSVLYLGNFGAEGGGDIPYSISHNSGRDADLAFYVLDAAGQPVMPPTLLPLDDDGRFLGEEGSAYEGLELSFDVQRNWKLVEGILAASGGRMQFIFISSPLRAMLLAEARRAGAPASVIAEAQGVLVQPAGALPHNDHFHLRMHCAPIDFASGCVERGRAGPGFRPDAGARNEAIAKARAALRDDEAQIRLAGVRRLALLGATNAARDVAARLSDHDPLVRAAAARALGGFGQAPYARELAAQLAREEHHQVIVELVHALGFLKGGAANAALAGFLDRPRTGTLPGLGTVDMRAFAAESLVLLEDQGSVAHLIPMLSEDDRELRIQARQALRVLTNHSFGAEVDPHAGLEAPEERARAVATWTAWYEQHRRLSRHQWLALGFQQAGLDVAEIAMPYVWEICRAIVGDDYLSYNAQRVLMGLSRRQPASLSWSKEDASFYWRRWFERRWQTYGAPPIPADLTTLD